MKRLYQLLIVFIGLAFASNVQAQESTPTVFTLEQCIDYALKNAVAAQNATLDEEIAQAKVRETIGIGLPQISASGTINQNQKLPRFFSTYNPKGGFVDVGRLDPGIKEGDVVAAQNFFQLRSSGDLSVNVNQIIFNGSYIVGLQASKAYKDLSVKANAQTKEQIVQQVTKAYYGVLINKERAELFASNIGRVDTLLRNTKALNQNGFAESIDVDRIRVTLNNLIAERDKFSNLNLLSVELLKFQMGYPMTETIDVSGVIEDIVIDTTLSSYDESWDYKKRTDYQFLEANRKLQELNIKNLRATALPSLSAYANIGMSTQSSDIGGLFQTNTSRSGWSDSAKMGYGTDKWYDYSSYGIRLTIPLFSGLQNGYKIRQQRMELVKINNNRRALESSINLETKQNSLTFKNAVKSLQAQRENMDLAGNIARITKIKYEQGVGSNLEVVDAEDSLRQSQTNYYNALYDLIIAKVDLDKAYGKLTITETK